jgi:hypothetical protein
MRFFQNLVLKELPLIPSTIHNNKNSEMYAAYTPLGIKISPGKTPREIDWQKCGGVAGALPPQRG